MMNIQRVAYGHPDADRLIEEVQEEYVLRYGGRDETPLDRLMFEPPAGSFYVGYLDGVPVASGAWRRTSVSALGSSAAAEVKRMYVRPPPVVGGSLGPCSATSRSRPPAAAPR